MQVDSHEASAAVLFDAADLGERPDRAIAAGRARSLARGIYTTDTTSPLKRVVREHIWEILARRVPDALIADRSAGPSLFSGPSLSTGNLAVGGNLAIDGAAFEGGAAFVGRNQVARTVSASDAMFPGDTLFVVSTSRARDLFLPGLRVAVRRGPGPFDDDPAWQGVLRRSSIPRALVENLASSRARQGIARTLSDRELAAWVDDLAQHYPAELLRRFRGRAAELADMLGLAARFPLLDAFFSTSLASVTAPDPVPDAVPDAVLIPAGQLAPPPVLPILRTRRERERAFFDWYQSSRSQGTGLTLRDALRIIRGPR